MTDESIRALGQVLDAELPDVPEADRLRLLARTKRAIDLLQVGARSMVKFTGDENRRTTIRLGLTRGNVERITKGQPIQFALEDINIPLAADVYIFFGEDEKAIADARAAQLRLSPDANLWALGHPEDL